MSAETIPFAPSSNPLLFDPPSLPSGGIVMSVDEYRQLVRASEIKYEYVDYYAIPKDGVEILENGEIRAMSGSAPVHNEVAGNVHFKIKLETRGRSCKTYFADVRVRVAPTKYRYPDVVALCGEAQFDADNPACLLNPSVLVEVLSSSTQNVDRIEKLDEYRQIPSLTDYVMIAQDRMFVTHYARHVSLPWTVEDYTQPTDTLTLTSIGVSISLEDIYSEIVFPTSA